MIAEQREDLMPSRTMWAPDAAAFEPTQWIVLLAAQEESPGIAAGLEKLCLKHWRSIY
jgi:hypothetical protein